MRYKRPVTFHIIICADGFMIYRPCMWWPNVTVKPRGSEVVIQTVQPLIQNCMQFFTQLIEHGHNVLRWQKWKCHKSSKTKNVDGMDFDITK